MFWAGTSYLLTFTSLQLCLAAAPDIFGRRPLLFISVLPFTVGSIVSGTAQGFIALLAGRAVQGIGGGGITALTYVIFTDVIPLRQRPAYIGLIQLVWALGGIIGPVIGGLIAQHTTWR